MKRFLSDFADSLRAKAAIRRRRDVKRAAEKLQNPEEMRAGEWLGEPLDLHIVPPLDNGTLAAGMAAVCEWNARMSF